MLTNEEQVIFNKVKDYIKTKVVKEDELDRIFKCNERLTEEDLPTQIASFLYISLYYTKCNIESLAADMLYFTDDLNLITVSTNYVEELFLHSMKKIKLLKSNNVKIIKLNYVLDQLLRKEMPYTRIGSDYKLIKLLKIEHKIYNDVVEHFISFIKETLII